MNSSFHPGVVSAIYSERGTVRVYFEDLGVVTDELQVVYPATQKSHDYRMPDVGESVVCGFYGTGIESGFVLGCVYNAKDPVPVADPDEWIMHMDGAGVLSMNRRTREIHLVDSYGSRICMRNGNIAIKAQQDIYLNPGDAPIPMHIDRIFD